MSLGNTYMSLFHLLPQNTAATDYNVHTRLSKGIIAQTHPTADKLIMVIISKPKLLGHLFKQQTANASL